MARILGSALLLIAVVFGGPYATQVLNRLIGPWSATAVEADGATTLFVFGQDLPRPEWVPVPKGASIVQASRLVSQRWPEGFHSLDVASRASLPDLKAFLVAELGKSGFTVTDQGIGPLNPATADHLGVAGMLTAERPETGDRLDIQIRTSEGLILPSRLVQLRWYKQRAS